MLVVSLIAIPLLWSEEPALPQKTLLPKNEPVCVAVPGTRRIPMMCLIVYIEYDLYNLKVLIRIYHILSTLGGRMLESPHHLL